MITDTWLRANRSKLKEKEVTKADINGLYARLRNGKITFMFRGTIKAGDRIKVKLGDYPGLSLNEARAEALKLRDQINEGHDPRKLRSAILQQNANAQTIDELYRAWYQHHAIKNLKNHHQHLRSYEIHLQGRIGNLYAKEIVTAQWVDELAAINDSVPHTADRLRSDFTAAYELAISQGRLQQANPLASVTRKVLGFQGQDGTRVLSNDEIELFYDVLNNGVNWSVKNRNFMELLLFYGCRSSELRETQREWLDFDAMTWTVPPEAHKTGKKNSRHNSRNKTDQPIVRPILPEMRYLWDECLAHSKSRNFLFVSERDNTPDAGPMSKGAPLALPKAMIHYALNHKTDDDGRPFVWERWSNHDLRRTARTHWSGSWEVREKMLGHKLPGVGGIYDHNQYTREMIPIYKKWWYHLKALENPSGVVVPIGVSRV